MKAANRPAKEVSFRVSKADRALVTDIVERAAALYRRHGVKIDRLSLTMDLEATHANGNRMDLAKLLKADDFNFAHDITGIMRHLDRTTGKLTDFFVPRYSAPKKNLRGRTSRADKRLAASLSSLPAEG